MPDHIPKPPYVGSNLLPEISSEYQIHDSEGIARMRAACELAARVLDNAGKLVRVSFMAHVKFCVCCVNIKIYKLIRFIMLFFMRNLCLSIGSNVSYQNTFV